MTSAARFAAVFVMGVCAAMAPRLDALVRFGSIVVAVTDQSGGAVPGAEVTVTQTDTSLTRTAVSNDVGVATLASLPPGPYSVRVCAWDSKNEKRRT